MGYYRWRGTLVKITSSSSSINSLEHIINTLYQQCTVCISTLIFCSHLESVLFQRYVTQNSCIPLGLSYASSHSHFPYKRHTHTLHTFSSTNAVYKYSITYFGITEIFPGYHICKTSLNWPSLMQLAYLVGNVSFGEGRNKKGKRMGSVLKRRQEENHVVMGLLQRQSYFLISVVNKTSGNNWNKDRSQHCMSAGTNNRKLCLWDQSVQ